MCPQEKVNTIRLWHFSVAFLSGISQWHSHSYLPCHLAADWIGWVEYLRLTLLFEIQVIYIYKLSTLMLILMYNLSYPALSGDREANPDESQLVSPVPASDNNLVVEPPRCTKPSQRLHAEPEVSARHGTRLSSSCLSPGAVSSSRRGFSGRPSSPGCLAGLWSACLMPIPGTWRAAGMR